MHSIQFDVQRLREEVDNWTTDDQKALEDMTNSIMSAIKSGKLDSKEAKDIVDQMFSVEVEEQNTTSSSGAYRASLNSPEKKYKGPEMKEQDSPASIANKFDFPVGSVKTGDGEVITIQDAKKGVIVYYKGFPLKVKSIYEKGGKKYIRAYSEEEKETVNDIASRFQSKPPQQNKVEEKKDVEPKLASGKIKKNVAVADFGYKPAPSVPNRKSDMIDYKDLWEIQISESYAKFKNQTKNRPAEQQLYEALKTLKNNLSKISTMFEYAKKLKSELGEINENRYSTKIMEKIQEEIKSIYIKAKKL